MDNKGFKLIVEKIDEDSLEYLVEHKNSESDPRYYIKGPFILMNEKNQNGRIYEEEEMLPSVEKYITEQVKSGGAIGEMNHPSSPDVNLERACDKIVSLVREGNVYIGKAMCLSTPLGKLQESLIRDKVRFGKSTRCLGQLVEGMDANYVKTPIIRAIDTVHNPSGQGKDTSCFVNGILENKEFIIKYNTSNEIIYDIFENSLSKLPRKDVEKYLVEQIMLFINQVK